MKSAQYWIKQLKLQPHPEGGYFNETYRCQESMTAGNLPERFTQDHCFSTAIYYLLEAPDFSAFHRIKQDELWHFYTGNSALTIHVISQAGNYHNLQLGNEPSTNQAFQQMVKAGDWFAASVNESNGFALVGCTVAPGFEFADFEIAQESQLFELCPEQQTLIKSLSKNP
ncbi:cupin domain-containing protein [Marinicella sp. S1101]|uniref:cupin domain-containing protein n=1 Tax=Marinicella marina TaxID=2996016 RepID=UPI002260F697|nr:cupin domain-containing protein [Marinicella marina]MCX7552832.1 cupin domain-containing protein [Marinicella marina]MDJ1139859.1 cupin domain-containing protein [Marinicella marina]